MRFIAALLITVLCAFAAADLAFAQGVVTAPVVAAPVPAVGFAIPAWLSNIWAYVSTPAAISGIVGFFMAVLPQGAPGTIWGYVRVVLDFAASNWGAAKNVVKA